MRCVQSLIGYISSLQLHQWHSAGQVRRISRVCQENGRRLCHRLQRPAGTCSTNQHVPAATQPHNQVGNPPIWFQSLIWVELLFQLPFFFVAAYAFFRQCAWIATPSIIYGIGVAATTFPIIVHQLFSGPTGPALAAIYAPYMIIPALVAAKFAHAKPWSSQATFRKPKRR